ncbi:MAG: glycoside hydrolase family 3 protein, partial [Chrysiogenetes bacterium]|nr:glycoside hydrolase family 3 protein [Chrysiogenetes bacterium]
MSMPEARSAVAVGAALIVMPVPSRVNKRLGIPPFLPTGASRGANLFTTAFPVSMARGASWDVELERRVHAAIGAEAKAIGANILYSPTINLVRHPGG